MTKKTIQLKVTFPFAFFLTSFFVGLKVCNVGVVATWSWLWVLAPLWAPTALALGLVTVFGVGMALFLLFAFLYDYSAGRI